MNKRFSILALVLAFFVLCSAFVACSTDQNDTPDKPKSVPIYQGMTVSAVDNSSRVASASFSFAKNRLSSPVRGNPTDRDPGWWDGDKYGRGDDFDPDKPFGDGATTIEDAASGTLEVVGGGETMYYAEADSDVIVTVKLRNPDAFEILSFTLNGKKYTGYMFERGSDTENIILKVNVGNVSGVVDYTIDAIKYVDGTEIKDVLMEGDKTVRVGVRSDDAVTCKVTNEKVTRNSVSFDVRVADIRSLVSSSGGYVKAVLYDGDQIRTSDIYVNATTHVVFYNLAPNTVYQYGVFGCYDDFGGEGVRLNQLYKQSVVTSATVLFGDADVQAQSLSWSYVWGDTPATERAFTSLTLWQGEQKVRDLDVAATTVDGLYTNCAYTLVAEYLVDGSTESIRLQFVTLAKQVPSVSLSDVVASQTGVRFVVNATDPDGVGTVTKVEVHSGTSWHITLATDASVCDNLLSDIGYTINVEYTYDLGDGNGKQTTYASADFATLAKATPTVDIAKVVADDVSVGFAVNATDPDGVGAVSRIELLRDGDSPIVVGDVNARTIGGLLSDATYTLKVTYTYDLNNGKGAQNIVATSQFETTAKNAPTVELVDVVAGQSDVTFGVETVDKDNVGRISAVELLRENAAVATMDGNARKFTNLLSDTRYTLRVTYSYNLNDGKGERTVCATQNFATQAKYVPQVNIAKVVASTNGVTFVVDVYDRDNVGSLSRIELLHGDDQPIVAANVNLRAFDGLMSANNYVLRVTYSYDLCDGVGARTKTSSVQFTTLPKATPSLHVSNVSATKDGASFDVVVTDVDEVGAVQAILFERDGESIALDDITLRTVGGLLSDNEYILRVVYVYDLCDGVGEQTTEATYTFTTLAKQLPQVSIGNFVVTRNSLRADIGSTDVDGVGAVSAVRLYDGDKLVATADVAERVLFDNLTADTNYTIAVDYTFDMNDGQGTQTLTQRVDYYTAPIFDFVRSGCANTSAVSVGEVIYFEAIVDNPSGVVVSKVKINGNYYDVAPATTANSVIVDITVDDGFEGGNTDLTMTEIVGTLHGQEMTLDVQTTENTATVFVNGELTVKSITIVDEDGNPCDYVVNGQTYYYLVEFNNKTGYNIDAVTIEYRLNYSGYYSGDTVRYAGKNVVEIDCCRVEVAVVHSVNSKFSGTAQAFVVNVEYSNELLGNKQKDTGHFESPFYSCGGSTDTVEIRTAEDLKNMNASLRYKLMNDIDLSGVEWSHPGDFSGSFDGQGHSILGMNFVGTVENGDFYWGLFAQAKGTVRNLKLQGRLIATLTSTTDTKYNAYVGGLCGMVSCQLQVDNVVNNVDLTVLESGALSESYIGGIFGYGADSAIITNCKNYGIINGTKVGGIVAFSNNIKVYNVSNHGQVSGQGEMGGIVGYAYTFDLDSCVNYGNILGVKYYCAGIVAEGKGTIAKCINYGDVSATKAFYVGGVGGNISATISQSINFGKIIGNKDVGGLVGYIVGSIFDSGNVGEVYGKEDFASLCGYGSNLTVENSFALTYNEPSNGNGRFVGGTMSKMIMRNCYLNASAKNQDNVETWFFNHGFQVEEVTNCYHTYGKSSYGTQKFLPEIIEIMRELWDNEIWDFDNLDQYGNPTLRALQGANE